MNELDEKKLLTINHRLDRIEAREFDIFEALKQIEPLEAKVIEIGNRITRSEINEVVMNELSESIKALSDKVSRLQFIVNLEDPPEGSNIKLLFDKLDKRVEMVMRRMVAQDRAQATQYINSQKGD